MDLTMMLNARSALLRCLIRMLASGEFNNKSALITDMIAKRMQWDISPFFVSDCVVFLAFDGLRIPKGTCIDSDVLFCKSDILDVSGVNVTGNVFYSHCIKRSRFLSIGGIEHMDDRTFSSYRASHGLGLDIKNGAIVKRGDAFFNSHILAVAKLAPKIDFLEYVSHLDGVSVEHNNTESSHLIRGNLCLVGPYEFNFPSRLTIDGDIIIADHLFQDWPTDMIPKGSVVIQSQFLIEDSDVIHQ